ncbi:hypothetical protein SAMN02745217_00655 [Anaerocolumna xylanovorans DSM 12503]|uniref:Uncharacterized protein n=1 Tax=Anaerocolumna xylanovorans DSM 12503 TaxID=1121345 RepID=A0A1M7XZH4_9FIRM|nr:hypothetical protein SAMN02745217_00655 [Anaerocolumna xylanovorans DSM 12503]
MGIHFKGILVVLSFLLPNIFFYFFPPQNIPKNLSSVPVVFTIMEQAGRILCLVVPVVFGKKIAEQKGSYLVILMALCLLVYYTCWILYFTSGREYFDLFKPMGFIPIPMAIFPLMYLILLGIWVRSPLFIAPAILFSIGHLAISWNTYIQLLKIR